MDARTSRVGVRSSDGERWYNVCSVEMLQWVIGFATYQMCFFGMVTPELNADIAWTSRA